MYYVCTTYTYTTCTTYTTYTETLWRGPQCGSQCGLQSGLQSGPQCGSSSDPLVNETSKQQSDFSDVCGRPPQELKLGLEED